MRSDARTDLFENPRRKQSQLCEKTLTFFVHNKEKKLYSVDIENQNVASYVGTSGSILF